MLRRGAGEGADDEDGGAGQKRGLENLSLVLGIYDSPKSFLLSSSSQRSILVEFSLSGTQCSMGPELSSIRTKLIS
jgi:hypothetical protein